MLPPFLLLLLHQQRLLQRLHRQPLQHKANMSIFFNKQQL
jgi:hypothetical protein